MKYSTILACMMVFMVVGVAQAKSHEVAQFQDLLTMITNIVGTVVQAVMTPILQVVQIVQDTIIAPIQNQVASVGLGFAVEQFCSLVVAPNFPSPTSKDDCIKAAKEELRKGFDSTWVEPSTPPS